MRFFRWSVDRKIIKQYLIAGLVCGLFIVLTANSFAALIFRGPLAEAAGLGYRLILFTGVAVGGAIAIWGTCPGTIAIPQDRIAPILALMSASIVTEFPAGSSPEAIIVTVFAAITLVSVTTGFVLLLMGRYQLGTLMRYIPFPVVGGFLAASGWLLVIGGLRVMAGNSSGHLDWMALLETRALACWVPGALLGWGLWKAAQRHPLSVVLPLFVFGSALLFHLVLAAAGTPLAAAREAGWLPRLVHDASSLHAFGVLAVSRSEWSLIAGQYGLIATIILTSAISVIMTASAVELITERDVDMNRELRLVGVVNVVVGLAGGIVGFQSLSLSQFAHQMKAGNRATGLIAAVFCLAAMLAGPDILRLLPVFVPGGLLLFLGISFLHEWLVEARRKLPVREYLSIIVIVATVVLVGYWQAIVVGLLVAVVLFVFNYSRVQVISQRLDGTEFETHVERPPAQEAALEQLGRHIHILKLQGFVFFGTAHALLTDARQRLEQTDLPALRFLVLDCRRVYGLDTSAVMSFTRLSQLAARRGFRVVLCQLTPAFHERLEASGLQFGDAIRCSEDLDRGVAWCEEELLHAHGFSGEAPDVPPVEIFRSMGLNGETDSLLASLERIELAPQTVLMREGESADSLCFLESGHLSVQLSLPGGKSLRLRKLSPGTLVGEAAFYSGGSRTASVVAEEPCVAWRFSRASLAELEKSQPAAAIAFHHAVAAILASRLAHNARLLHKLFD